MVRLLRRGKKANGKYQLIAAFESLSGVSWLAGCAYYAKENGKTKKTTKTTTNASVRITHHSLLMCYYKNRAVMARRVASRRAAPRSAVLTHSDSLRMNQRQTEYIRFDIPDFNDVRHHLYRIFTIHWLSCTRKADCCMRSLSSGKAAVESLRKHGKI